jgi:hypothetical protein
MEKAITTSRPGDETYVDVEFESMVDDLYDQLRELRIELSANGPRLNELLDELCRGIRQTKLEFMKIVESYGETYRDDAQRFVDLAFAASDLAQQTQFSKVSSSLCRHAQDIHAAQLKVKAVGRPLAKKAK